MNIYIFKIINFKNIIHYQLKCSILSRLETRIKECKCLINDRVMKTRYHEMKVKIMKKLVTKNDFCNYEK